MFHSIKRLTLVLGAAALALTIAGCTPTQTGVPTNTSNAGAQVKAEGSNNTQKAPDKVITLSGQNYSFSQNEIRVKKGETIKIVFNNQEGFHDWVLDEFGVRTPQIAAGATAEVTFTADKTGTFEYYCSVGQHRQNGMRGNLIVE